MKKGFVKLEVVHQVGYITFYHPAGNSLPSTLLQELQYQIKTAGKNDEIKTIVLQSEGKTFCAGASFDELMSLKTMEQAEKFFMGFAHVINAMRKNPKFIIAKVQGKAVGGGVGLIAASDYAIAHHNAAIKLSELSLGIGPYVIAPAVKRKINTAAFSELSINASNWHTAFWAREKGLYAKVSENMESLWKEIELLTNKLVTYDPLATEKLKFELWKGTEHWDKFLKEQAKITAELTIREITQNNLRKYKK